MTEPTIWREPTEETSGLYPGLVVWDERVSGSITVGESRLPLWAFVWTAITHGWDEVELAYQPSQYGWGAEETGAFLHDLMEARGEFGRLLLVLADAERCDRILVRRAPWWQTKRHRKRVSDQLRRCLAVLDGESPST